MIVIVIVFRISGIFRIRTRALGYDGNAGDTNGEIQTIKLELSPAAVRGPEDITKQIAPPQGL